MNETIQLDQVLNEIADVEKESHELDEEQYQLRLKAKVLAEKIIQELKKRNKSKQKAVNELKLRIGELESQLGVLSASNIDECPDLSGEEASVEELEDSEELEETMEPDADNVTITEVNEVVNEDFKRDKKKRKLF